MHVCRTAHPVLRPLLLSELEGWAQSGPNATQELREVPFPGVPLVLNLAGGWTVGSERHDSFVAGLHTRPAFVAGSDSWACIELRLTPLAAHRLLRVPMHELAETTVPFDALLPAAVVECLADAEWEERFAVVDEVLSRRLLDAPSASPAVVWAWERLRRTRGRARIGPLAEYLLAV
jgi:hypothetical protein